jgi:hypothetical protein
LAVVERELPVASPSPSADAIPPALRRRGGTPRQVLALTLIGTLVLAVFAAADLSGWLYRMGDGPVLARVQYAAAEWDRAMRRLDLTRPAAFLHEAMRRLLDAPW